MQKEENILSLNLAETEHKLVVRIPRVVGPHPTAVQPQTAAVASEVEDVRVASGVRNLLHTDAHPLS